MKRIPFFLFTIMFSVAFLSGPATASAPGMTHLKVDEAVICENVSNREPVGTNVNFQASIGRLYCFTRILGAKEPTTITHVWFYENTEKARVDLAVNASSWRTYSSKKIQPSEVGSWRVEVLGPDGTVLKVIQFNTTSEQKNP
jgi:hypothetical protein